MSKLMTTSTKKLKIPATWWYLWRLIRYRLGIFLISALLGSILYYLLPLLPGLIVRAVFDEITAQAQVTLNFWALIASLTGVALARMGIGLIGTIADATVRGYTGALLRRNVLERILLRSGANALPNDSSPGEAVSRFRDDVDAIMAFMGWMLDPVGQVVLIIAALLTLAHVNMQLTLIVVAPLVVVMIVVNLARRRILAYRRSARESVGDVTGLLGEVFSAITAVKIANAELSVVDHLRRLNEARRTATLTDTMFSQVLSSIAGSTSMIGVAALLLVSAQYIQSGQFTVGDFALFTSYIGWLSVVASMFGDYLTRYRQTGVSFERLVTLLHGADPRILVQHNPVGLRGDPLTSVTVTKTPDDALRSIQVIGLTYHYPNSVNGINNVSFHLRRGEFVVITGKIGSGKTTLLRTLIGLLPKEAGEIRWNDSTVSDPASFFVPPRSAYTPQVPRLFSESLRDNILLGWTDDGSALQNAIWYAVFERDVQTLAEGVNTGIGPRGVKLSGGQVQRAAAARMFVRDAELLLFDDLSSALDVETEELLWKRLRSENKDDIERIRTGSEIEDEAQITRIVGQDGLSGRKQSAGLRDQASNFFVSHGQFSILAVSHRRAALQRADKVLLMQDGKVIAQGKLDELLKTNDEMRRLYQADQTF